LGILTLLLAGPLGLTPPAWAQDGTSAADGQQVFVQSHCSGCHGELGYGGAGPPLRGNHILPVTDYVIAQILVGRGIMPSFADKLDDRQIAAVATYIRTSWGNKDGPVDAASVTKIRQFLTTHQALPAPSDTGE
jgi:mono/diheme cytochrome c family protein